VLITVTYAPDWAEGPGQDRALYEGTWKPDASAFNDFAHALAQRYSGTFGNLPRVRYFEPWAEPNLPSLLESQYQHGRAVSPEIYGRIANAFYAGVKSVHRDNLVIGPALAPFGDPAHNPRFKNPRMRPIRFLRQLLCLKDRRKLKAVSCPDPVNLDVISHHALGPGPPTQHAINPDDAGTVDLGRIMRVVRAAQRHGTIRPKGIHRKLWATEYWWISDPPSHAGVRVPIQAQVRKGHRGWKTLKRRSVKDGEVFKAPLRLRARRSCGPRWDLTRA
jgi:hypothetical protein